MATNMTTVSVSMTTVTGVTDMDDVSNTTTTTPTPIHVRAPAVVFLLLCSCRFAFRPHQACYHMADRSCFTRVSLGHVSQFVCVCVGGVTLRAFPHASVCIPADCAHLQSLRLSPGLRAVSLTRSPPFLTWSPRLPPGARASLTCSPSVSHLVPASLTWSSHLSPGPRVFQKETGMALEVGAIVGAVAVLAGFILLALFGTRRLKGHVGQRPGEQLQGPFEGQARGFALQSSKIASNDVLSTSRSGPARVILCT